MKTILAELDSIQIANAKGDAFERVVKRILETAPEFRSHPRWSRRRCLSP